MTPEQLRQRRRDKERLVRYAGMTDERRFIAIATDSMNMLAKIGKKPHQWRMKQIVKRG